MDFRGLQFDHFGADGTRFIRCDFSGARIAGFIGIRRRTRFEDCRFAGSHLAHTSLGDVRFLRCVFSDVDITGWADTAAEFVDCRFTGRLTDCKFWGRPRYEWLEPGRLRPPRTTNDFYGNDFREADLSDVGFVGGVDLTRQRLPDGPQYVRFDRPLERIALVRNMVTGWEPGADREEALIMLDVYSEGGFEDQSELFANRWEAGFPREVAETVWELLETANLPPS
jgi:hypothetical protein